MADSGKEASFHVEHSDCEGERKAQVLGTNQLLLNGEVVLIPTPSCHPRDPLNLPAWRKILIVVNVSIYAATATLMASSFGAILPVIREEYGDDPRVNDLVTFPALFIGIGNLIFVPVAHAIGRRPVYLYSLLMLIVCCVWAANSKSLGSHIAARDIMSLAAGQAEALCPIMVQELYFLHERANKVAWFCGLQTLGTAALTVASSYLASSVGWRWWYGVFAIINGVCFVVAIFTVVETHYDRATNEIDALDHQNGGNAVQALQRVTTSQRQPIDYVNYPGRTWKYDLALFQSKADWSKAITCWKQMLRIALFPNVLWLVLVCGIFLGVFVIFGAVFAGILVVPPYNFEYSWIGFVFAGQIVVSFVVVPVQGYLSDYLITYMSKRNNGVTEPEYRLITLIPPFIVGITTTIIFGHACAHPNDWHWSAVVVSFNAEFYAFVGTVIASFTYVMDSYPGLSDAGLVVLCFARGVISFGLSYGALDFVSAKGYVGTFNICAIIMGALGGLGVVVYFSGKVIRRYTEKWAHE